MNNNNPQYDEVSFKNRPVRILRESTGLWLCLYDLCKAIKRPVMMETKEAINLCPSSTKIVFKQDNKPLWAIAPRDVHKLVHLAKKENSQMKKLCEDLETWTGKLLESEAIKKEVPVVFNYQDHPVTFKAANGKTYVNATNMAKCFGGNPAEWLRKAATIRFRHSLVEKGKSASLEEQVITNRGTSGGTWIQEELAMEYARELSPDFSIWCNERITELVTCGTVSIIDRTSPTQHGSKSKSDAPFGDFPVPKTFEEALLLAAQQQKQLEESRHKIEFYNHFIEDRDWFKTTTIADELQITPSALNQFLEEEGIIHKEKGKWVVSGFHASLQCEVPYYWTNAKGKSYRMGAARRWTQAGREYIIELWNRKHINRL